MSAKLVNHFCLTINIIFLALLTSSLAIAADLRIIHLNDFHGWVESPPQSQGVERLGGAAQLTAQVKTLRQEKPSLFLAAGDMIQGSSWTNFFKGSSTIKLLNLMRLDAMVVGNHEKADHQRLYQDPETHLTGAGRPDYGKQLIWFPVFSFMLLFKIISFLA